MEGQDSQYLRCPLRLRGSSYAALSALNSLWQPWRTRCRARRDRRLAHVGVWFRINAQLGANRIYKTHFWLSWKTSKLFSSRDISHVWKSTLDKDKPIIALWGTYSCSEWPLVASERSSPEIWSLSFGQHWHCRSAKNRLLTRIKTANTPISTIRWTTPLRNQHCGA